MELYTHDWVYDHPLAQGTNWSLDSSTCGQPNESTKHVLAESLRIAFWLAPGLPAINGVIFHSRKALQFQATYFTVILPPKFQISIP